MKKMTKITSVESKATFQEKLLERFVEENLPPVAITRDRLSNLTGIGGKYKEFEACAAETPVYGSVEIFYATRKPEALRRVSFPVTSRFFVFCTRHFDEQYKVALSCSLS